MSELSPSNYVRINLINWFLSVPMIVLFAWPYYYAAKLMGINEAMRYIGAFIFSIPFIFILTDKNNFKHMVDQWPIIFPPNRTTF